MLLIIYCIGVIVTSLLITHLMRDSTWSPLASIGVGFAWPVVFVVWLVKLWRKRCV